MVLLDREPLALDCALRSAAATGIKRVSLSHSLALVLPGCCPLAVLSWADGALRI